MSRLPRHPTGVVYAPKEEPRLIEPQLLLTEAAKIVREARRLGRREERQAIHARLLAVAARLEALPADSYGRERADALREFALELED